METIPKMMMQFARGNKRFFLISVIASALASLMGFLTPLIVGFTIDAVIGGTEASLPMPLMRMYDFILARGIITNALILCAVFVAVSSIIAGIFNYFSRVNMAKCAERTIRNLRDKLYKHTQNLPFEWHTKNLTGDIIQRCTSDVETTRRFLLQQLIEVLRIGILIITALIIMFSINVRVALVSAAFLPIILSYTIYFSIRIAKEFHKCDEAEGELMVKVQENLTGVRVVRAFGRERYETDTFNEKNVAFTNKWLKLGTTFGMFWGVGDIVSTMQSLAVLVYGSILAVSGAISIGDLLVFLSYTLTIMWPIRALGRILSDMSQTSVSLKRIKEILDAPAEEPESGAICPPLNCDIAFKNVTFTYGTEPVLKDVSFTIKHGSVFGILGATGAGKSTITYLLNRLYDLPEDCGEILVGGVDVRKIDKPYLRSHIGLVLQEPFLYSKTIFENIDIASKGKNLQKVREKAEIAAVDDSIMSFSKGYDTIVGERGVTLSGGQKQRIAIARTLMMDCPIMVFDDSMSSLDMETDAKIREALRENTAGATVIIISHRISTLMTADQIMVLEGGGVAEIGSHAELLRHNGVYKRVHDLQSGM
jgi:ATP-binding cassette subfamily B protein